MAILLLAAAVVIVDQLSKYYIQQSMYLGMSLPVIDNIFHITYILNSGAAFGILQNQRIFFIVIAVLMLAAIIWCYASFIAKGSLLLRLGIGLMAGGAIGNLIDRMRTGHVVDFFDFRIWPVFNVADIAIVSGVCLIVISLLYLEQGVGKDGCND